MSDSSPAFAQTTAPGSQLPPDRGQSATAAATSGDQGAGAFATGNYRNLFLEAHHPKRQIDEKVKRAFQQLFHGDPDTQAVYFSAASNANGPLAYIRDIDNNDVRTEGMSYGMMIAVQLDKKREFDALWNWAKTYMGHDQPQHPARGYFSWSMKIDGTPIDEMPAPDGEEYFATALYFAAGRWGSGTGIFDYRAEADRLLTDMRHREEISGETAQGRITAGSIFDPKRAMVRFTPASPNADHTDPSYQLPAFYEVWARWGPPEDREFWKQAATNSRAFFRRAANSSTGLTPDYANFDGSPWAAPGKTSSADFYADAWRTGMNWSVDWSWWHADEHEPQLSDRLQAFFESQGLSKYANHYSLDGQPLGADHSTGRHQRRGQPGRHEAGRQKVYGRALESANPDGPIPLL